MPTEKLAMQFKPLPPLSKDSCLYRLAKLRDIERTAAKAFGRYQYLRAES